MRRRNVNDYQAFIAVAREKSFTKAAAQLGVSQSALSYTVRTLEADLGLRLLMPGGDVNALDSRKVLLW